MTLSLWLARHGSTEWTEQGRLCGWSDPPLNLGARAQAGLLRRRLAGLEFDGTWTSDLIRAAGFAELAGVTARPDRRLRELDFGELEGKTWSDLDTGVQESLAAVDGFAAPGGESVADLESRVDAFIGELDRGNHLIFTHGGVIRLLGRRRGLTLAPAPGQMTVLDWEGTMAAETRREP